VYVEFAKVKRNVEGVGLRVSRGSRFKKCIRNEVQTQTCGVRHAFRELDLQHLYMFALIRNCII
jgi:hypothetical protein